MQLVVGVPPGVWNVLFGLLRLGKTWTFWDVYKTWTCAKIYFRHKWEKLDTLHFSFIELVNNGERLFALRCFLSVDHVLNQRFSRIALLMKRLQLGSKSDLTTDWLIFEILLGYALFGRCIINVDWNLQQLLEFVSFWRRHVIPIFFLSAFCYVLWIFL